MENKDIFILLTDYSVSITIDNNFGANAHLSFTSEKFSIMVSRDEEKVFPVTEPSECLETFFRLTFGRTTFEKLEIRLYITVHSNTKYADTFLNEIVSSGIKAHTITFDIFNLKLGHRAMMNFRSFMRKARTLQFTDYFNSLDQIRKVCRHNSRLDMISFYFGDRSWYPLRNSITKEETTLLRSKFDFLKSVCNTQLHIEFDECVTFVFLPFVMDLIYDGESCPLTLTSRCRVWDDGRFPVVTLMQSYNKESERTRNIEVLSSSVLSCPFLYFVARFV
jgi:hypothetical protein